MQKAYARMLGEDLAGAVCGMKFTIADFKPDFWKSLGFSFERQMAPVKSPFDACLWDEDLRSRV